MNIKSIIAAALGTLMLSESAFALSCARPDLVKTLEDAKASEKLYYILVGKFTPISPQEKNRPQGGYVPPEDPFKPKPPVMTSTFFEGYSLAKHRRHDGYLSRFPVDIETSCAGPWCSNVPSENSKLIAFVEVRDGQPPLLKISPCPSFTFAAEKKQVKTLRQCLDRSCEPQAPNW
jgi:hypothetical protein